MGEEDEILEKIAWCHLFVGYGLYCLLRCNRVWCFDRYDLGYLSYMADCVGDIARISGCISALYGEKS